MSIKPYYKTNSCALYQCDNLELMKQLPDSYIDLIYCDILYGKGRSFSDYQDLKSERNIIDDHYLIRISEMNRLLKETGKIFIHGKERNLERGCHMNDWWTDINSLQTWSPERLKYNTQKPKPLLDRIIESATKENEIIADFYMGCGTTEESAVSLNRKFIGCDIGERACKITQERLEKYA